MKRFRLQRRLFLVGAAAVLVWCVQPETQRESGGERRIEVVAHRGGAADAPENTLAAIERAVKSGADMVEIDLRMTEDGVPVVLHDTTLLRTAGLARAVYELNSQEVRKLDVGTWFSPDFAGERIPVLTELLEAARGRIRVMIELKDTPDPQLLLERTIEAIRSMDMEAECILASTSPELLFKGKALAPELENVCIAERLDMNLWELSYVDGYSISISGLSVSDVERAHGVGCEIYAWTVNEPQGMERAADMGVNGIVTDDPCMALEILANR